MSYVSYRDGYVDPSLLKELLSITDDFAGSYHTKAILILQNRGFLVSRDHIVPNRGDGRRGKIDIVAFDKDGWQTLVIELDRKKPRNKSIFKVKSYLAASGRLVICRSA